LHFHRLKKEGLFDGLCVFISDHPVADRLLYFWTVVRPRYNQTKRPIFIISQSQHNNVREEIPLSGRAKVMDTSPAILSVGIALGSRWPANAFIYCHLKRVFP
jgi:hypothetical protein